MIKIESETTFRLNWWHPKQLCRLLQIWLMEKYFQNNIFFYSLGVSQSVFGKIYWKSFAFENRFINLSLSIQGQTSRYLLRSFKNLSIICETGKCQKYNLDDLSFLFFLKGAFQAWKSTRKKFQSANSIKVWLIYIFITIHWRKKNRYEAHTNITKAREKKILWNFHFELSHFA